MRVADANGFVSVRQLFSAVQKHEQGAFEELCVDLRLNDSERARLFGVLPGRWGFGTTPLGLKVADFNQACRRWCPLCLREVIPLQGHWTLKLACVCIRHEVWLHDVCPCCGALCRWTDVQQGRCRCDERLENGNGEQASLSLLSMNRQLCGVSPIATDTNVWSNLDPAAAHRLVRYLGNFTASTRPAHPGQVAHLDRMPAALALVTGTVDLLQEWPLGLHKLMATLQASTPQSPSVRRTFAPLYRVLYNDLPDPCYQFLRDAFEQYLHQHWWGLVCRRNRRMKEATQAAHPRITVPQAARAANVSTAVVRHLVQASLLPDVSTPLPSGRQARTIHTKDLPALKDAAEGAVSLEKAARILALPRCRLRDLIAAEVLFPLISRQRNQAAAAWLISKKEIDRLHVVPLNDDMTGDCQIHVRTVLKYWRLRGHEAVLLIQAVLDNELRTQAQGRACKPVPIGTASLVFTEAKRWLANHRRQTGEDVSVDQAAQALGIKQQVAYGLVRAGLLIVTSSGGALGRRISADGLNSFKATYVSLADLARDAHRSPRALLADISVTPVCGPSIDGCRQYFYRRTELAPTDMKLGDLPHTPRKALS